MKKIAVATVILLCSIVVGTAAPHEKTKSSEEYLPITCEQLKKYVDQYGPDAVRKYAQKNGATAGMFRAGRKCLRGK